MRSLWAGIVKKTKRKNETTWANKQKQTNCILFQLGVCWAISACRTFPKSISKAVFVSPGGQRKAHTSQRYRADMQSTTDGNIELWYFESCISMWNFKLKPSAISPSSISKLVLHHACYPQRNDNYLIHTNNCLPNRIMIHWCKSPYVQNQSACRCVEHGFSQHHGKPKPFSQKKCVRKQGVFVRPRAVPTHQ